MPAKPLARAWTGSDSSVPLGHFVGWAPLQPRCPGEAGTGGSAPVAPWWPCWEGAVPRVFLQAASRLTIPTGGRKTAFESGAPAHVRWLRLKSLVTAPTGSRSSAGLGARSWQPRMEYDKNRALFQSCPSATAPPEEYTWVCSVQHAHRAITNSRRVTSLGHQH